VAGGGIERLKTPIIEDGQLRAAERPQEACIAACGWIDAHENLILCRPIGIGKKLARISSRPQSLLRQSDLSSTNAFLNCSPTSRSRTVMAVMRFWNSARSSQRAARAADVGMGDRRASGSLLWNNQRSKT
jgi:hypothetical protein